MTFLLYGRVSIIERLRWRGHAQRAGPLFDSNLELSRSQPLDYPLTAPSLEIVMLNYAKMQHLHRCRTQMTN